MLRDTVGEIFRGNIEHYQGGKVVLCESIMMNQLPNCNNTELVPV